MRGLRYILNIELSFYSIISNEEVIEQMNLHLNSAEHLNMTGEQFMVDKICDPFLPVLIPCPVAFRSLLLSLDFNPLQHFNSSNQPYRLLQRDVKPVIFHGLVSVGSSDAVNQVEV